MGLASTEWVRVRPPAARQDLHQVAFRTGEVMIPAMIGDLWERVPDASPSEGWTSNGETGSRKSPLTLNSVVCTSGSTRSPPGETPGLPGRQADGTAQALR